METGIIILSTILISGDSLAAQPPWPAADRHGIERHWNAEAHVGQVAVGVYAAEDGTLHIREPYPVDEVVQVLHGELVLTPAGGVPRRFSPGDWVYVPKGFVGTWQMLGGFREIHIVNGRDAPGDLSEGLPVARGEASQAPITLIARTLVPGDSASDPPQPRAFEPGDVIRSDITVARAELAKDDTLCLSESESLVFVATGALGSGTKTLPAGTLAVVRAGYGIPIRALGPTKVITVRAR
jgi:uncharacterized cupin superfamily protein